MTQTPEEEIKGALADLYNAGYRRDYTTEIEIRKRADAALAALVRQRDEALQLHRRCMKELDDTKRERDSFGEELHKRKAREGDERIAKDEDQQNWHRLGVEFMRGKCVWHLRRINLGWAAREIEGLGDAAPAKIVDET